MSSTQMIVLFGFVYALAMVAFAYGGSIVREIRERRLLANGLAAEAQIVAVVPTGNYFNHQPEMRIRLEVRPVQGQAFEAELIRVVGVADMPRLAPGREVSVRYSPPPSPRVTILP